jgi:hypothetical protein
MNDASKLPLTTTLRATLALAGLMAALAVAPAAHASTASFSNGTVTITTVPGETNVVWVYGELSQYGEISDTAGITPGPGCNAVSPTQVECGPQQDGGSVTYGHYDTVVADLGDGNDEFVGNWSLLKKVDVKGGDGADQLGSGYADVAVFDGGPGDDVLRGTDGDDQLTGGPGNDRITGDDGSDVVDGGQGQDDLKGDGGLGGSNGNDRMLARDGERDTVSCDLGADSVTADTLDIVETATCESVDVGAGAGTGPGTAPGGGQGAPISAGAARVVTPNPRRSIRRTTLAGSGLVLRGSAGAASVVSAKITVSKAVARKLRLKGRTLASARKAFAAGPWSLRVTVTRSVRRRLKRTRPFTAVVSGSVRTTSGSRPFKRTIKVR